MFEGFSHPRATFCRFAGHSFLREAATWKALPKVNPYLLAGVYLTEPRVITHPSVWGRFFLILGTQGPVPAARYTISTATLSTGVEARVCSQGM